MTPPFRTFKPVPGLVFAPGCLCQLPIVLHDKRRIVSHVVFIVDHFFADGRLVKTIDPHERDMFFYLDTTDEPTTGFVNGLRNEILGKNLNPPSAVVGIGGGSTLDVAKALSIVLANGGKAEDYQGWDLVPSPGIYKIGVPTISGTGAEVSRTAVLTGPAKKQGINSDYSFFDFILLDSTLLRTVPKVQRFYTGMDCYIHCMESLSGCFINEFSRSFASKAMELCRSVFLENRGDADLMVASLMGGYSIVYSEVGLVHALAYGISWAFHIHHGEANCIVFNALGEYYPAYMDEFRRMLERLNAAPAMPKGQPYNDDTLNKMVEIVLLMERPLHNALGPDWRKLLPKEKIKDFFYRILESA